MIGSWFPHRATISRAQPQPDGHRADDAELGGGFVVVRDQVPCRFVAKDQRIGDGAFAERPIVTTYLVLFGPKTDIRQADLVRVAHDDGTYRIASILPRRGRDVTHVSCRLDKLG